MQINLTTFDVQRSSTETGIFTKINTDVISFTGDLDYGSVDNSPLSGDNFYRIAGKCGSGANAGISMVIKAL